MATAGRQTVLLQHLQSPGRAGGARNRRPDNSARERSRGRLAPVKELNGRVAVVTGAASGIGLALVEGFVSEGMRVVMADVNVEALTEQATPFGASVHTVVTDVRDPEAVDRVGAAAIECFGALHIAVNNAGIVNVGYSWELSLDEWHRVIDVN